MVGLVPRLSFESAFFTVLFFVVLISFHFAFSISSSFGSDFRPFFPGPAASPQVTAFIAWLRARLAVFFSFSLVQAFCPRGFFKLKIDRKASSSPGQYLTFDKLDEFVPSFPGMSSSASLFPLSLGQSD